MNKRSLRVTDIVLRTTLVPLLLVGWVPCLGEGVNSLDRSPDDVKKLLRVGQSHRSQRLAIIKDGVMSTRYSVAAILSCQ